MTLDFSAPLCHCAEPDAEALPGGRRSGATSPLELSFTAGGGGARLNHARPPLGSGARRGLDLRFNSAADNSPGGVGQGRAGLTCHCVMHCTAAVFVGVIAGSHLTEVYLPPPSLSATAAAAAPGLLRPGAFSSPPLHRITEQVTLEGGGRTLQQEIEEAAAAIDSHADLAGVEVLEAAAPEQQQQAWDEASPSPPPPPEVEVQQEMVDEGDTRVLVNHGKVLKQQRHFFTLDSSSSPGSSPGIQAVHNASDVAAEQEVVDALRPIGGSSCSAPLPQSQHSDAHAASSPPAQHEADLLEQRALSIRPASSSSGGGGLLSSPFALQVQQQAASRTLSSTEVQLKQQVQVQELQRRLSRQASEEGEDVFARFSSYQEMEAHFQRVAAAEGLQQLQADAAAAASEDGAGISRFGSLRHHHPSAADAVDITAASSFSGGWEVCFRSLAAASRACLAAIDINRLLPVSPTTS